MPDVKIKNRIHDAFDKAAELIESDNTDFDEMRAAVEAGVRGYADLRRCEAQRRREALIAKQTRTRPADQYLDARDEAEPEFQIQTETEQVATKFHTNRDSLKQLIATEGRYSQRGTPARRAWLHRLLDFGLN